MIPQLIIPALAAMLGSAFVCVWSEKGQVFGWWPPIADRLFNDFWLNLAYRCTFCVTGQIALWTTVIYLINKKYCWLGNTFFVLWNIAFATLLAAVCIIIYKQAIKR